MRIYSTCQKCKVEINSTTPLDTRGEHAMRKGDFINLRCTVCNFDNQTHIDDFIARESKSIKKLAVLLLLVGLMLSAIVFLWLVHYKGVVVIYIGMFGIPLLIYGSLIKYDQMRVSTFNRFFSKK